MICRKIRLNCSPNVAEGEGKCNEIPIQDGEKEKERERADQLKSRPAIETKRNEVIRTQRPKREIVPCIDKDYTGRIHSSIYFSIRRDTEIRSFCGIQRISSIYAPFPYPYFSLPLLFSSLHHPTSLLSLSSFRWFVVEPNRLNRRISLFEARFDRDEIHRTIRRKENRGIDAVDEYVSWRTSSSIFVYKYKIIHRSVFDETK